MSASSVSAQSVGGVIELQFEESIYPRDAVFGAAYVLLDRAFVHLDRQGPNLVVRVRPKPGCVLDVDAIAGEFENEALAQSWRRDILHENRQLLEGITARAIGGAAGPPGLDDLLDASLGELGDAFDDPLGIAVSWEEKYGKGAERKAEGATPAKDAEPKTETTAEAAPVGSEPQGEDPKP